MSLTFSCSFSSAFTSSDIASILKTDLILAPYLTASKLSSMKLSEVMMDLAGFKASAT